MDRLDARQTAFRLAILALQFLVPAPTLWLRAVGDQAERELIPRTIVRSNHNIAQAAALLELIRSTLAARAAHAQ